MQIQNTLHQPTIFPQRKEVIFSVLFSSWNFLICSNYPNCNEIVGKGRRWGLPKGVTLWIHHKVWLSHTFRWHTKFIPKWVEFGPANLVLILLLEITKRSKASYYSCWMTMEYLKYLRDRRDLLRFSSKHFHWFVSPTHWTMFV